MATPKALKEWVYTVWILVSALSGRKSFIREDGCSCYYLKTTIFFFQIYTPRIFIIQIVWVFFYFTEEIELDFLCQRK